MIDPSERAPTTHSADSNFATESGAKVSSALELLRNIGAQLLILSDAQLAIWKMKLIRLAALTLLAVPLSIAFLALAVYGFILLDRAAATAMNGAQFPDWVSPLLRGGVYSVFTLFVAISFWRQHIGSVASNKE